MYRDYTYVDDIVDGILKIINNSKNNYSKNIKTCLSNIAPFRILNIGNTKNILMNFINALEKD